MREGLSETIRNTAITITSEALMRVVSAATILVKGTIPEKIAEVSNGIHYDDEVPFSETIAPSHRLRVPGGEGTVDVIDLNASNSPILTIKEGPVTGPLSDDDFELVNPAGQTTAATVIRLLI